MRFISRKRALCCMLICCILLSLCLPFSALAATGTLVSNNGTRHEVCTELSPQATAYYTGVYSYESLSRLSGRSSPTDSYAATQNNPLYSALHSLMSETQSLFPKYNGYEPTSLATYWLKTDAEEGSDTYLYFYTDRLRSELSSTTLNREHVWPKSKASFSQNYGGADLHHLRPSIASVNLAKSDHRFCDIPDDSYGMTTSVIDGEVVLQVLKSAEKVEARDNIKGDIARILLYVYCRWEQPNLYSDVASDLLPDMDADDTTNYGTRAIEDLDTLLRWCESDPVDRWEMQRNDQTENVQGNRNVFIDYPELAWLMFGLTPPETMVTPSGEAAAELYEIQVSVNDSSYGTAVLSDNVITATPAAGCELVGYELLSGTAVVEQNGNSFTVEPDSDCHIQIIFAPKTLYTLSFSQIGEINAYAGETIALPQSPEAPDGYTFLGWSISELDHSTAPSTYYPANSQYTVEKDQQFYALYSYEAETAVTDGSFVKLTQAPEDWSGEYLLVYDSYSYVFNGSLTNPNSNSNCRVVTISHDTVSHSAGNAYRVTISPNSKGYSLRMASGLYLGNTSGYTGLAYSAADSYGNSLSMNSDGSVNIASDSGAILGFQTSLRKFQFFSTSSTSRRAISLYRKITSAVTTLYTTILPEGCSHKEARLIPELPATCTEAGCGAYYLCDSCGLCFADSSLSAEVDPQDLSLPALGHNLSYSDEGSSHSIFCTRCEYTESEAHRYENGMCVCGATEKNEPILDEGIVIRHSLNLASDISINYAVSADQLLPYDRFYLSCSLPVYEGNQLTGSKTIEVQPVLNGSYYYFTLTGITAVSTADQITATLYMDREGERYASSEDLYSVSTYAYAQLSKASSTEELKTLCANLLRYGAAAQTYKAYRTDALADEAMTEVHRSYLCDLETVPFGSTNAVLEDLDAPMIQWAGKALNLESKVVLRFIMDTASYSGQVEDLSLHIRYLDYTGAEQTKVLTAPTPYGSSKSYYAFDFDGLLAAELRTDVSVTVYAGDTRLSNTMLYSAATYGSNKTGALRTLCQALLAYSDAALAQFT